jgi:hypothetical protein
VSVGFFREPTMSKKTDRLVAEAKLDRAEELIAEINQLENEIDKKMSKVDRLTTEAQEVLDE